MERLSRRSFLVSTTATLGGIALASCGGTSSSNGSVTLRWSMWVASQQERVAWEALASNVKKAYPNITVNLETTAFNPYWDKLQDQTRKQHAGRHYRHGRGLYASFRRSSGVPASSAIYQ